VTYLESHSWGLRFRVIPYTVILFSPQTPNMSDVGFVYEYGNGHVNWFVRAWVEYKQNPDDIEIKENSLKTLTSDLQSTRASIEDTVKTIKQLKSEIRLLTDRMETTDCRNLY